MHTGPALWAQNLPDVCFSGREPHISWEPFSCQYTSRYRSLERLSDLAVLPIENHCANQPDTSGIVDVFAQEKARKRKFDERRRRRRNGVSVGNWTRKTTLLNNTIQYVTWLAVRPISHHRRWQYFVLVLLLLQAYVYADAGRPWDAYSAVPLTFIADSS